MCFPIRVNEFRKLRYVDIQLNWLVDIRYDFQLSTKPEIAHILPPGLEHLRLDATENYPYISNSRNHCDEECKRFVHFMSALLLDIVDSKSARFLALENVGYALQSTWDEEQHGTVTLEQEVEGRYVTSDVKLYSYQVD